VPTSSNVRNKISLANPICWIPIRNDKRSFPVAIEPLDGMLIQFWNKTVQPCIDSNYQSDGVTSGPQLPVRADVGWNWWKIWALVVSHNFSINLPAAKNHSNAIGWAIVMNLDGQRVPVGLLTVVPNFLCNVGTGISGRSFAWYLSNAPGEFFDLLQVPHLTGIAEVLIDAAVQSRLDIVNEGSTLLHADPGGGARLKQFYELRCGMSPLIGAQARISIFRPAKPGEYFTFDDKAARGFCRRYDARRRVVPRSVSPGAQTP
jgi:hypothetical protein